MLLKNAVSATPKPDTPYQIGNYSQIGKLARIYCREDEASPLSFRTLMQANAGREYSKYICTIILVLITSRPLPAASG